MLLVAVFSAFFPRHLSACLWDQDTLAMERRVFPGAHELMAGYFVRHSDAYYEWRISDRRAKPTDQLLPTDLDDIAVAHDKLGDHDKAIETILEKIERWPEQGRYESEANLGTFYIHSGQLEEGREHIRKAIAINPDAHFGREIYQQLLVEYLIEKRRPSKQLPISEEIQAAAKGVMGMMRFGNHDSPVLLEALGDLLLADDSDEDSKQLATRAYLRASMEVDAPEAVAAYRHKAFVAIAMQKEVELNQVEEQLLNEIKQGDELFHRIAEDETAWIATGLDVDAEFEKKYLDSPARKFQVDGDVSEAEVVPISFVGKLAATLAFATGLIAIALVAKKNQRRRKASAM
ncbi:hypothetical protein [Rhodopirellula islandica]|nr:hypothetical protein [Rhodopirellula islandica]